MAADTPLSQVVSPNLLDIPEDHDGINEIFADPYFIQFLNDSDTPQPDPGEIDDEHSRSELTPTLQMQERGSKHRPESNSSLTRREFIHH